MSTVDPKQLAQQFIDGLHRLEQGGGQEIEALAALFADDAELANPQIEERGERVRGPEGVRRFWEAYRASFRDIRSEFRAVTAGGDAAGLFWSSKGTDAQGHPVEYEGATLLRFDPGGRIRSFRGYFDSRALGA